MLLLLGSCKTKTEPDLPDMGFDYCPVDSGWVRTYSVDSISFNDNTKSVDTFHFILTEQMEGEITGQNLPAHRRVERRVKFDSSLIWETRSEVFVLRNNNTFQRVEENARIVKLVFPIGPITSWNGYQYLGTGRRNFQLQQVGADFSNGDTLFRDCIMVQEAYANNAIEDILVRSVYSRGVGLVDFINKNVNTQISGKSGYAMHYKLIEFNRP